MDDAFANIASFLGPNAALPPAPARRAAAPAAPPRPQAAARAAPLLPALEEAKAPPRVRAVVFSKDRAFQLRCHLRSLARAQPTEVFVLWRAEGDTSAKAYATVQAEFPSHRFLCDGDAGPAANLAIALADAEFVWFLVDDALVVESFDVVAAATALRRDDCLLAVHARLHPGVTWCHPQDAPCAPPAVFDVVGGDVGKAPALLAFDRSGLSGDWSYAWDLAGGLYRGTDASAVVRDIVRPGPGNDAAAHPNRLEANGNAALRRLGLTSQRPRSACPAVKALVIVTVNRVQDVYSAPVYDATPAPSLDALDALVDDAAADLDVAMYAKTSHDSAHVGDWFPSPQERPSKPPRVSVLIAAKNEEATIVDAVRSALDEGDIVEEVVVIDDHSTDGTRAAVAAIDDARVRVLESSGHGLAEALNFGLKMCSCDVVARLDADDVFAAGQLNRHVARFADLRRRGRVAACGGAAVSWWPDGARAPLLRSRSGDAEWSLLFSCCVAHPTVLLDRRAVLNLDGYASAAEPAEDYDLWLRAADAGAGVANASDIPRTWLRKRSTSVSAARRAAQEAAADAAVARSIGRRLGTEPPPAVVSAMRRPATCESADALDGAAALLSSLRARAVAALAEDARATKRVDADASQRLAELQACGLRLGRVLGVADGKMEALRGLCAAASLK
ncbi:unnamed protein product [Pelagomonas calceolata]|uniref:Glycosyltransferase 2-like domain-containing protein n=1 Tax=Pelagomonas calceolata TaxID=35677 RepID=A0A8J2SHV0_9STRA|nr:unnamed protein product [Pelagomonas calceolata]